MLAVLSLSRVSLLKQPTYPIAEVIKCVWNANVFFIMCPRCSFAGTLAAGFQNFTGGIFLVSFVVFKLEMKL